MSIELYQRLQQRDGPVHSASNRGKFLDLCSTGCGTNVRVTTEYVHDQRYIVCTWIDDDAEITCPHCPKVNA